MAPVEILVVDDEEDILELVAYNLRRNGYRVECVKTGEAALAHAKSKLPDLIILDLMLPEIDGLQVCGELKKNTTTALIPIVMLTAKGEEADVVTGLELGADDYLSKPFSPRVLLARIRAVLRRQKQQPADNEEIVRIHNIVINPGRHEALVDGRLVDLTFTEFRLLHLLARRPGWVSSRQQIIEAIRGFDYPVTERSVDVQVAGLRKKLRSAGCFIETVRGVGYRFKESE
ncbi:MAG TPA: response regulator transcription factor [Candidatus Brocadiia bacterium]|nr:response regulator transcription factor [Candidatus Brocadiia bacterium]